MFPIGHFNKTSSGDNTIQEGFVHNLLSNDVDLIHLHRRCKVFKNVTFAKNHQLRLKGKEMGYNKGRLPGGKGLRVTQLKTCANLQMKEG